MCVQIQNNIFMINRAASVAWFCLLVSQIFLVNTVNATELPDVQVSPPPEWVEPISFNEVELKQRSEVRGGEYYLLFDKQTNAVKAKDIYKHYAIKLLNENAVQENSRISVSFSPDYQSLVFHDVIIWRNGIPVHQPINDRIKLLQREKELENLIYDGRWTATLLLEDVRKGDILEYNYTIKGQNPAYGDHINELNYFQWSVPIGKQVYRLIWPDNKPVLITAHKKLKDEIKVSKYAGHKVYRIERTYYPTHQVDSEAPDWFDPMERIAFSSVLKWENVVNWGIAHYKSGLDTNKGIAALGKKIQVRYKTRLEQASAALRYVQDEVRYVGIEVGAGGFIPTQPDITLKRRYGDCKDKTYLLLTILKALEIEAYPVLADTSYGERLGDDGPRLNAFNHVLVKAVLDGKSYWLETTVNNQSSTLDKIYQPDYGQALVLSPGNGSLTSMYQEQPYHKIVYDEVFDMTAGVNEQTRYTVNTVLIGKEAEKFRRNLNSKGKKRLVKEYLEFYAEYYKDISFIEDIEISDNKELNLIRLTEKYLIPNIWKANKKKKRYYARFYNNSVYSYIKKPRIEKRNSPFKYSYPVNLEQNIALLLPDNWNIKNNDEEFKTPFFNFTLKKRYLAKEKKLTLEYKYQALKKYIKTDEIGAFTKALDDIDGSLEYRIYSGFKADASDSDEDWISTGTILLSIGITALLLLVYTYIEFRINQKKTPPGGDSSYYAVASSKVFILSIVTYGGYLMYWFYKNWDYVKLREKSSIIPWGRAFFYSFWYYPLYKSFGQDDAFSETHASKGRNVRYALLAVAFLVFMVATAADHVLSYVAFILLSAAVLPLVEKINQVNLPENEYFRFNSRWRPRHYIFISLFTVITLLDISISINLIPNNTVVRGNAIWDRDIRYMHRIGVLSPEDKLLLFYSDALFSYSEDGNGLSDTGVFSYWKDDDTVKVNTEVARYSEIADVKYRPNKSGASTIQIKRKDGSDFVLYAQDSSELYFYNNLMRYWKNEKRK